MLQHFYNARFLACKLQKEDWIFFWLVALGMINTKISSIDLRSDFRPSMVCGPVRVKNLDHIFGDVI